MVSTDVALCQTFWDLMFCFVRWKLFSLGLGGGWKLEVLVWWAPRRVPVRLAAAAAAVATAAKFCAMSLFARLIHGMPHCAHRYGTRGVAWL